MAVLKILSKNDNEAISRFWKSNASDGDNKRTMLFHTLAMLDVERLHAWIASTPTTWWDRQKERASKDTDNANAGLPERYNTIAGGMLQYLHLENRPVFMELLEKSPHLFKSQTCRYYMDEWCKNLSPVELQHFQPLLATQASSWYVTNPERIKFLLINNGPREDELMLSAAVSENGVMHPLLEAKYPGAQSCVLVAHGMFSDTKQKKQFLRKWMLSQNGPQKETLVLELPALDS